ncbi:hypothetical protein DDB_G0289759 [Dictyostelium discoideum AX4]|uniref:Uncharacterized protein n=1 Tax=Dictyostelium discoideum TaxID=44689 RepID=Q54H16_DICDI|nr:hypothetical protein DDB_G0289759 [Dictyostelium discoideum AX4]EAL62591.1 hypothetical protein DDB_G0289759 [Dictyostelium discoideum AX4]|eukprot:XP_636102.1 hypothetical protein DDB_G0289759 [Dictyostelium discoideum AX4]
MKNCFFIFLKIIFVTVIISKYSIGEIVNTKCYKCLNEFNVCQTIENDILIKLNETLICNDQLGCVSDYSMPSMHPDRTSSCNSNQGKYGDQCEVGNEGFCGYQMTCDYPFNISLAPTCVGFKTLQPGENCICNSECNSLICDENKLVCIENQYSCNVNSYWNGTTCENISNLGDSCSSDSQCSIFNTCENGICIEKYSLNENSLCISDSACNISNSLICIERKCQVFKKSNTTNCKIDGCLKDYEYCNCDSGLCEQSKIFNDECKYIQYQLDACVYGRCVYTGGYVSSNSCVMKNCGSLVCQHHTKCTNGPCGNNNSSFCISNTYIPNNITLPNSPTNNSENSSSNSTHSSESIGSSGSNSSNSNSSNSSSSSNSNSSSSSNSISNSSSNSNSNSSSNSISNSSSSSSSSSDSNETADDSSYLNSSNGGESIGEGSTPSSNSTNSNESIGDSDSFSNSKNSEPIDDGSNNSVNSDSSSNSAMDRSSSSGSNSSNSTLGSKENSSLNSTDSEPNVTAPPNTANNNGTKNHSLNATTSNGYYHSDELYIPSNSTNSSHYSFSLLLFLLSLLILN